MTDNLSPIDKLLDRDNSDNIVLYNSRDDKIEFEQIAAIPIKDVMYVILSPTEDIPGVSEDEGMVFKIAEDEDGIKFLARENDPDIIDFVFDVYNKILDDAEAEAAQNDYDEEDFDEDLEDSEDEEDFDEDFDDGFDEDDESDDEFDEDEFDACGTEDDNSEQ